MGDEDEEEESDAIVAQVLDELGLQLNDKLGDVPVATGDLTIFSVKLKCIFFFIIIIKNEIIHYLYNFSRFTSSSCS